MQQYTILVVEAVKSSLIQAVSRLHTERPELGTPHIVLLTTTPEKYRHYEQQGVSIVACDFEPATIQKLLADVTNPIKGVICRGDMYVQYLRKVVPYLPTDVPASSEASLEIATNKRLMREAFQEHCPQNTPRHVQVKNEHEAEQVTDSFTFPVIVKPTSLASSLMIQKCDDAKQLTETLRRVFADLEAIYAHEGRTEPPEVIVEEYLEGDFYSVDSYVVKPGEVYHTPLVYYVPAKQLGIDDFFLYKRTTPVELPPEEVKAAETATQNAIAAAGLQYTSVHTELVRTHDGSWKIIEIGPRLGRFRNTMYREAFAIDHSYNDVLARCGFTPDPTPKQHSYCAAYSIYPEQEGTFVAIRGVDEVQSHVAHVVYSADMSVPGAVARYARNGGHALYEVVFVNDTAAGFRADCEWFEATVKAVIKPEEYEA